MTHNAAVLAHVAEIESSISRIQEKIKAVKDAHPAQQGDPSDAHELPKHDRLAYRDTMLGIVDAMLVEVRDLQRSLAQK